MDLENNQSQQQPKKPSFFQKLFGLGKSKAKGILKQQGGKVAVKLAKKAGLKGILTAAKGVLASLPEGASKVIAVALTVLEKVGGALLVKLKKALKKPDKALYAIAGMTMLPLGLLLGGPIGTILAVGGTVFLAASTIAHVGSKAVGFLTNIADKAFSLAVQQPINFAVGLFNKVAALEVGVSTVATPTFGTIGALAGTGAITVVALASAFYVPSTTRLSPWQEKSQYIRVEKKAFFIDKDGNQNPINNGEEIDNDQIQTNTGFVYEFTITATGADLTGITASDLTSSYQELGEYIASDLSWELGEIPDLANGESWTSPQYSTPTSPVEKFQDAMLANQVSVTATALVPEEGETTPLEQVSFDSLAIIIGTPKTGCPMPIWPIDGPITITQGPGGSHSHTLKSGRKLQAIDLAVPIGTPVKATVNGAYNSGFDSIWGNYVKITSLCQGRPLEVIYAHLDDYNNQIQPGHPVTVGQIIGYSGNTGKSTGPHLHYEFTNSNHNAIKMAPPYIPDY